MIPCDITAMTGVLFKPEKEHHTNAIPCKVGLCPTPLQGLRPCTPVGGAAPDTPARAIAP